MEIQDKRVMRRKQYLLEKHLVPAGELLQSMKQQGLLTDHSITTIMKEEAPDAQTKKLLEALEENSYASVEKICFQLENRGLDWVADELQSEMLLERGKIQIEEYIQAESTILVKKSLEDEVSEEKIAELGQTIAGRRQVTKEAATRQMARRSKAMSQEVKRMQDDVIKLYNEIEKFLKDKHGAEGRGTLSDTDPNSSRQGTMRMLSERIKVLSRVVDHVMEEQQDLLEVRDSCYDLLGSSEEEGKLDDVLEMVLTGHKIELGKRKEKEKPDEMLIANSVKISQLEDQLRELRREMGRQLSFKNVDIENMSRLVKQKEEAVKTAEKSVHSIRHERDLINAQMEYWRQRCEVLEKTKRLGYYYLSWYDQHGRRNRTTSFDPKKKSDGENKVYFDPDSMIFSKNGRILMRDALLDELPTLGKPKEGVNTRSHSQPPKVGQNQQSKVSFVAETPGRSILTQSQTSKSKYAEPKSGVPPPIKESENGSARDKSRLIGSGVSRGTSASSKAVSESTISLSSAPSRNGFPFENGKSSFSHCKCCPKCCVEAEPHNHSR